MTEPGPPGGHSLRVVLGSEADHPEFVSNVLAFRKRVLVDALGWDLPVHGSLERDEFDTEAAIHGAVLSGGEIIACFRAIRCDDPYLGLSKFPQLATRRAYPRHAFAWEISRFAVAESARRFEAALMNYAAMFQFARNRGAVSLVAFCDLSHERLLGRIGIVTERFGDALVIGVDRGGRPIRVVAGEIPLQRQAGVRFEKLVSLAQTMEIDDAAAAVGRPRVSA